MLASEIMNRSAVLLNDSQKQIYTFTNQLPYLNTALDELMEMLEANNVSITNEVSTVLPLTTGTTTIAFASLPTDLVEIQELVERDTGTGSDWIPVTKVSFLPDIDATAQLVWWTFQDQELRFIGATRNKEIKLSYIAKIQVPVTSENSAITIINSRSFLSYRTAGLCAEFIGENPTRATSLNQFASMSLDRMLGINVKANQILTTRRRPFMFGWKSGR